MPTITIKNLNHQQISFRDSSKTVLKNLHENYVDWMHACGEKGRCTTCKMIVHSGQECLSDLTELEEKYASLGKLRDNERLTCQSKAAGDIEISVPESSKLPHLNYSA